MKESNLPPLPDMVVERITPKIKKKRGFVHTYRNFTSFIVSQSTIWSIAFILFLQNYSTAQSLLWGTRAGNQWRTEAMTVAIENSPGGGIFEGFPSIIVAGEFLGNTDFDPGEGEFILENDSNTWDVFVQKLDHEGNLVWAKRYGNEVRELEDVIMAIDSQNNIYLTGYFITSTNLSTDPETDLIFEVAEGSNEMYLLKLNSQGNPVWARTFPVTNSTFVNVIKIDSDDNILLAGHFRGTMDFDPLPNVDGSDINQLLITPKERYDAFVLKINSEGEYISHYNFGPTTASRTDVTGLITDQDNNIYLAGEFRDEVDFGNANPESSLTSQGFDDGFLMKLNTEMELQWVRQIASGDDSVDMRGLSINSEGKPVGIVVFGRPVNLSPHTDATIVIPAEEGHSDFLIYQLNPENGDVLWHKHFRGLTEEDSGFKEPNSIGLDADDNIYITGAFKKYLDADPGEGEQWLGANHNSYTSFLIRLAPDGSYIWSGGIGSGTTVFAHDLAVGDEGQIAVVGTFSGQVDFDPGNGVFFMQSGSNISDIFTLLFSGETNQNTSAYQFTELTSPYKVYPNPFSNNISIESRYSNQKLNIHLTDIAGRVIWSESIYAQNESEHKLALGNITPGIYFLSLESNEGRETVKLIKK